MSQEPPNPTQSTSDTNTLPPELLGAQSVGNNVGNKVSNQLSGLRMWPKGVSGNPSGRPKIASRVKALARKHTTEALEALRSIMVDPKAPVSERRKAANDILAWGHGRPVAQVTQQVIGAQAPAPSVTVNVGGPTAGMSPDQAYQYLCGNPDAPAERIAEAQALLALPSPTGSEQPS
jgi:hypothetical protein